MKTSTAIKYNQLFACISDELKRLGRHYKWCASTAT